MTTVAFVSVKGSPGVTTTSLLSALCWKAGVDRKVFVEADPSGGSVALQYQMSARPGLMELVNAKEFMALRGDGFWRDGQKDAGSLNLWDYAQPIVEDGLRVVLAHESPLAMSTLLGPNSGPLVDWLKKIGDVDVIFDLGRLWVGAPTMPIALAADMVFVVVEPVASQLIPATKFVEAFIAEGGNASWLLVGDSPYGVDRVEAETGVKAQSIICNKRLAEMFAAGSESKKLKKLYGSVSQFLDEAGFFKRGASVSDSGALFTQKNEWLSDGVRV